jgi:hypothetical protein
MKMQDYPDTLGWLNGPVRTCSVERSIVGGAQAGSEHLDDMYGEVGVLLEHAAHGPR